LKTKKCHSCGEEVDNTLAECPQCGNKVPGGSIWGFIKFVILFHVVVFAVGAMLNKVL